MRRKVEKEEPYKWRIATYNAHLHNNAICPANHSIEYANGWYYFDGEPEQKPYITRISKEIANDPTIELLFSDSWNTYVLSKNVAYRLR